MVKAGGRTPGGARPPARRKQVSTAPEEKPTALTPARILTLRKKLGLSQAELGLLVGVNRSSVLSWEKGKSKPKAEKAAQLAALATKGKEEVRKLLGEKKAEQEAKPKMRGGGPGKKATKPH
jgi:DNA-binding transcriptional regulator YiaG